MASVWTKEERDDFAGRAGRIWAYTICPKCEREVSAHLFRPADEALMCPEVERAMKCFRGVRGNVPTSPSEKCDRCSLPAMMHASAGLECPNDAVRDALRGKEILVGKSAPADDRLKNALQLSDIVRYGEIERAKEPTIRVTPPKKEPTERVTIGQAALMSKIKISDFALRDSVRGGGWKRVQEAAQLAAIEASEGIQSLAAGRERALTAAAIEIILDTFGEFRTDVRVRLEREFAELPVARQWAIWDNRNAMAVTYQRNFAAQLGNLVGEPSARQAKKKTTIETPAVGEGPRRYFDEE